MVHLRFLLAALFALGALVPLVAADGGAALAREKLKTGVKADDVQAQSGQDVQVEQLAITAEPFAFAGVGKVKAITRVALNVTLEDLDAGTGPNDIDSTQPSAQTNANPTATNDTSLRAGERGIPGSSARSPAGGARARSPP